jgi:hypothetical protein
MRLSPRTSHFVVIDGRTGEPDVFGPVTLKTSGSPSVKTLLTCVQRRSGQRTLLVPLQNVTQLTSGPEIWSTPGSMSPPHGCQTASDPRGSAARARQQPTIATRRRSIAA